MGDRAVRRRAGGGGERRRRAGAALRRATRCSWTRDEHDSYVAAISHLPLALSSALFSVAFGSAGVAGAGDARVERLPRHDAARVRLAGDGARHHDHEHATTCCTGSTASARSCRDSARRSQRGESETVLRGVREAADRARQLRRCAARRSASCRPATMPKVSLSDILLGSQGRRHACGSRRRSSRAAEERAKGKKR